MRPLLLSCAFVLSCSSLLRCSSDSTTSTVSSEGDAGRDASALSEGGSASGSGGARASGGAKASGGASTGGDHGNGGTTTPDAASDSGASPDANESGAGGAGGVGTGGTGGIGTGGVGTGGTGTGGVSTGGTGTGGVGTGGTGTGGVGTGGTGTGGTGGGPPLGEARFVNVSPGAPALDVCMKLTSDASYTTEPIFHALGRNTGLAFGEISNYLDLGFDSAKYYDFVFVGASTGTCAAPYYGAIGTRLFSATVSTTIAIYQYSFGLNAYNGAKVSDTGTPTGGKANVRFLTATQTPATADFYATPNAGVETKWFSAVPFQAGTTFHVTDAGTYSFRITSGGTSTTIAQQASVALSAATPLEVLLYPSDATHFGLMRCPSTQTTLVSVCAP